MHEGVVPPAEQDEVIELGQAAVRPVLDVVRPTRLAIMASAPREPQHRAEITTALAGLVHFATQTLEQGRSGFGKGFQRAQVGSYLACAHTLVMKLYVCVLVFLAVACTDDRRISPPLQTGPACGNGRIEAGEQCDGNAIGSASCVTLAFGAGALACGPSCQFDSSGCGAPASCGNGTLEAPERCDTARGSTTTCAQLGFGPGALACAANCATFDTSGCGVIPTCGNGVREDPERCDGTQFGGGATCPAPTRRVCSASCREITCAQPADAGMSLAGDAGVTLPDAAADPCAGVTCSGHGTCAVASGSAVCICDARFEPHGIECLPVPTGAPTVTLRSRVASLDPQSSAVFEATVSDPDGLADVLGGELRAPTGQVYGQFVRAGAGTFTIETSWSQLNNVVPISGAPGDTLAFTAVFFDAASNMGSGSVTLPIVCPGLGNDYLICSGLCSSNVDTNTCGSCSLSCPHSSYFDKCVAPGVCEGVVAITQDGPTCAAACMTHHGASAHCVRAEGEGATYRQSSPATCAMIPGDPAPNAQVAITLVWCVCGQGGSPASGQSCTEFCAGQFCSNTQVLFDYGGDALVGCGPPYQILGNTVSTLSVGSMYNMPDTYGLLSCTCEHPAL